MLPTFIQSEPSTPVEVPAPRGFRSIVGTIHDVQFCWTRTVETMRGNSAARENGLRYERTVQEYVQSISRPFGNYLIQPELTFHDDTGFRRIIPDCVLLKHDCTVIVEVKIQHMPEAWWQLRRLYQPVLEAAGRKVIRALEIVKTFDAAMPFPEPVELVDDLMAYLQKPTANFAVHVWRP